MKTLAIERQFGSGGREIGMRVAQRAGIPYYDGEILLKTAEARGVPVELLRHFDEKRTGSTLYDIAAFSDFVNNRQNTIFELYDGLQRTIRDIERQGPAVFIGRCATQILRDCPDALRVFIYSSDKEKRAERIMRKEGVAEAEARNLMQKVDKQRQNYFRFWTQKEWEDRNNYDLELNTSIISIDGCADILLHMMQASQIYSHAAAQNGENAENKNEKEKPR